MTGGVRKNNGVDDDGGIGGVDGDGHYDMEDVDYKLITRMMVWL